MTDRRYSSSGDFCHISFSDIILTVYLIDDLE